MDTWPEQDAKSRFSELQESEEPQLVTRRGTPRADPHFRMAAFEQRDASFA